eukprot:CAMPEP_0195633660 /NCGR_PEP_ID=MMETSP0815-20121206/22268_1 /TAXON_ID=97485 /ORGANISM="Prymnesium parvum, Strain Texoma1" /LENGTH=63 /DNA_ID=CAMNT_0040775345 /DNA_START=98 /DNA_END=289 /DNA_ORIENTATION=-
MATLSTSRRGNTRLKDAFKSRRKLCRVCACVPMPWSEGGHDFFGFCFLIADEHRVCTYGRVRH